MALAALMLATTAPGCGDDNTAATDTSAPSDTTSPDSDATTDPDVVPPDTTPGDGTSESDTTASDTAEADTSAPVDTSSPTDTAIDPDILQGNSILGVASRAGNFQTFLAAVQRRGLVNDLATAELTVFAPTDAAFEAYRAAAGLSADELLSSPQLDKLLRYHVVAGKLDSAALGAQRKRASLIDVALYFDTSDGVKLNVVDQVAKATVVTADIAADNGFLHAIDAVLVPPRLIEVAKFEGLAGFPVSLEAADLDGLDDDDAQHTLFAPNNDAFFDLLRARGQTAVQFLADPEMPDIMRYRVVVGRYLAADLMALDGTSLPSTVRQVPAAPAQPYFSPITIVDAGGSVRANNSPVAVADILAVNGVIHIMGGGMPLPHDLKSQLPGQSMDTFLGALDSQGLSGKLVAPEGPVTVFGPINFAFAELSPADMVGAFHIVPGIVLPADLVRAAGTGLQTLAGTTMPVSVDGSGNITVGGARTSLLDGTFIPASNGILYVIGDVLAP